MRQVKTKLVYALYEKNKGADQPSHMCRLICAFIVHCLKSLIVVLSTSEDSRF